MDPRITIETGKAILGIEFGSTRIKAVLVDQHRLDTGGAEFDAQDRFPGFDGYSRVHGYLSALLSM
jgi:sugar (pentulose or hexulose) kinase